MNLNRKYTSSIQELGDGITRIEVRQLGTRVVLSESKAIRVAKNRYKITAVNGANKEANQYGVDLLTKYLKGE